MKPMAVDLCCGLGGWTEGLMAEGWEVIGFDVERHDYGNGGYPGQLVIQDIRTINGSRFHGKISLVVASPPCTEFSYMAMPWRRGKQIAHAILGRGNFPDGYKGSKTVVQLTELFDACIRIGREAGCPTIIENVRGAQPWVGRARWNFGSYYLWGDVPALMPITMKRAKLNGHNLNPGNTKWRPANGLGFERPEEGIKLPGNNSPRRWDEREVQRLCDATKHDGLKNARNWWSDGKGNLSATTGSHSKARKAASAAIAKIPFALAAWVAKVYYPCREKNTNSTWNKIQSLDCDQRIATAQRAPSDGMQV